MKATVLKDPTATDTLANLIPASKAEEALVRKAGSKVSSVDLNAALSCPALPCPLMLCKVLWHAVPRHAIHPATQPPPKVRSKLFTNQTQSWGGCTRQHNAFVLQTVASTFGLTCCVCVSV